MDDAPTFWVPNRGEFYTQLRSLLLFNFRVDKAGMPLSNLTIEEKRFFPYVVLYNEKECRLASGVVSTVLCPTLCQRLGVSLTPFRLVVVSARARACVRPFW